jgi:hypothetical protein
VGSRRSRGVEAAEPLLRDGVKAATRQVFAGARPTPENAFKIALAERTSQRCWWKESADAPEFNARRRQPVRQGQGRRQVDAAHRRSTQDHRHRPYAYERHDVAPNQAYGYIVGAGIGKGRIISMDASAHVPRPAYWRSSPHRKPSRSANRTGTMRRCSADPKWPTTTRPSPAWWQRPSSRPAPPRR